MFSETTIDRETIRPMLQDLGLVAHREPVLIYAGDQATSWRVRLAGVNWRYGVAECLMALSYQWATLEPGTDAIGVWLPQYQAVQIVDAMMHCHVIGFDGAFSTVPEQHRIQIAGELRALIGTALARPGRASRHHPIVIARCAADVDSLVRAAAARGHRLEAVTPKLAPAHWQRAARVYIHHQALAEVAGLGLGPRADIVILAPRHTASVREFASQLRTDDIRAWPQVGQNIAESLARHRRMLALATGR